MLCCVVLLCLHARDIGTNKWAHLTNRSVQQGHPDYDEDAQSMSLTDVRTHNTTTQQRTAHTLSQRSAAHSTQHTAHSTQHITQHIAQPTAQHMHVHI
jgi:hypothetical protein